MDQAEKLVLEVREALSQQAESITRALDAQTKTILDVLDRHLRSSRSDGPSRDGGRDSAETDGNPASGMYRPKMLDGAQLTPNVLVKVERFTELPNNRCEIKTCMSKKGTWGDTPPQIGEVPRHWIREAVGSDALLPFTVNEGRVAHYVIPTEPGSNLEVAKIPESEPYWRQVDLKYRNAPDDSTSKRSSLMKLINLGDKIQEILAGIKREVRMVMYSSVAGAMSASLQRYRMVPSGVGFFEVSGDEEGQYLSAILNADCMTRSFSIKHAGTSRRSSQMFNRVQIPLYDSTNPRHSEIANLYAQAQGIAEQVLRGATNGKCSANQVLKEIRAQGVMKQIDTLVSEIAPNAQLAASSATQQIRSRVKSATKTVKESGRSPTRRRIRISDVEKSRMYDKQEKLCNGCRKHVPMHLMDVDHRIPIAAGGKDDLSNMQLLCSKCNQLKGKGSQEKLIATLRARGALTT